MTDTQSRSVNKAEVPVFTTYAIPSLKCGASGNYLLSVNDGLPATEALEMASLFLDSVIGLLDGLDAEERSHVIEAAVYLATLAKSAVDAVEVSHGI